MSCFLANRSEVAGHKVLGTREGAGVVASDSLAAESARSGGGFADNQDGEPFGESDSKPTFANKDIAGTVRLDPATDSEARQTQEDWAAESTNSSATSYPYAAGGQSKGLAVENTTIGGGGEGVAREDVA